MKLTPTALTQNIHVGRAIREAAKELRHELDRGERSHLIDLNDVIAILSRVANKFDNGVKECPVCHECDPDFLAQKSESITECQSCECCYSTN